jgi:predicted O-methyltransferase YrrM
MVIEKLIAGFEDNVLKYLGRETGKPKVHDVYNTPHHYRIIWGSDFRTIKNCDFGRDIFINQGVGEFTALLKTIQDMQSRSVGLEIGFFRGATHLLFRELFDKFISVEINPSSFLTYLQNDVLDDRSELVIGASCAQSVLDKVKELSDGKLDFVFIDGDHSYRDVKLDFLSYWPLIQDGGMIAMHDAASPDISPNIWKGVCRFLDELKELDFHVELIYVDYTGIAIIRKDETNKNNKLPYNGYMDSLDHLPENIRLCIYGVGEFGKSTKKKIELNRKDIEITCLADTFKSGRMDGLAILNTQELKNHIEDFDLILIASIFSDEIEDALKNIGIYNYKVAMPCL